ncbi:MAG: DUF4097 family beta strand repeat-containing protein [Erysipelotrichales bacterium]
MKNSIMKKLTILGFALVGIGIIICLATGQTLLGNSIRDHSDVKMVDSGNYDLSKHKNKELFVNANYSKIEINRSNDNKIHYEFHTANKKQFSIEGINIINAEAPIAIEVINKNTFVGFNNIGNSFIKISVPDSLEKLSVDNALGEIEISNISELNYLEVNSSVGGMKIKNSTINKEANLESSVGDIKLDNINVKGNLLSKNSMGDIKLNEVYAGDYIINNSIGSIKINNKKNFKYSRDNIRTSIGSVKINEGEE